MHLSFIFEVDEALVAAKRHYRYRPQAPSYLCRPSSDGRGGNVYGLKIIGPQLNQDDREALRAPHQIPSRSVYSLSSRLINLRGTKNGHVSDGKNVPLGGMPDGAIFYVGVYTN